MLGAIKYIYYVALMSRENIVLQFLMAGKRISITRSCRPSDRDHHNHNGRLQAQDAHLCQRSVSPDTYFQIQSSQATAVMI